MTLPAEGGCRCGGLRFRVTRQPIVTSACHCTGCQRMSGSAFSTTAMIPLDGFAVIAGTPVIGGLKGPDIHHHHCPDCHGWVFTTFDEARPFVNLRAVMLDDTAWFAPFIETYVSEKLPWAQTGAPHSYPKFPSPEEYPGLIAGFAATLKES
ncbi:GFA family protein [Albidovulum sp.]|uniref:GFA family protein n=1 Tax=Albidovulum sp. TaxID=1872424 RepID=UPI003526D418